MDLPVEIRFLQMEFTSRGRRLPWLGPALRGMVARAAKDRFCHWSVPERDNRWKFCRGCPHMDGCPYGLTFEPDPPGDRNVLRTIADGQRAISLSPFFPVEEESCPGDVVQVRMVLLGRRAIDSAPEIIGVLTRPTRRFTLGSDQAEVAFRELAARPDWPSGTVTLSAREFSTPPDASSGRVPWLALSLSSPMFLQESPGRNEKSRVVMEPNFSHLLRASLRVVGRAFAVFGTGPLEESADFAAIKAAAGQVRTLAARWQPFRQAHRSNRRLQRYDLLGITGGAVFADVPIALLPWLVWGGRIGVGEHRVAGAGCWQLTLL